jgi:site-specific DNA-cytosine methylase
MISPSEAGVPHPSVPSGLEAGNRLRSKACGHRPVDMPQMATGRSIQEQIGNAVPPLLAWHVARAVGEVLR